MLSATRSHEPCSRLGPSLSTKLKCMDRTLTRSSIALFASINIVAISVPLTNTAMVIFTTSIKSGLPLFLKGNDWPIATTLPIQHEGDDDDDDDDNGIDVAPAA
ncbi:hypothetical protein VNO77_42853 [Canavalia gladiata]|uniref:Uncharacterized protein n=1 Tax=Canavalia gladiata TaxID=3824 RepID=A0AAN9JW11_CANGL